MMRRGGIALCIALLPLCAAAISCSQEADSPAEDSATQSGTTQPGTTQADAAQTSAAQRAATEATQSWLDLVDTGDYGRSWDQSAALFRGVVTRETWSQSLTAVRTPLGEQRSRQVKSARYATSLPGAPDGEYVVIQFNSAFAHKSAAVETVTSMRDPDGAWRVSGYFIK